MRLGPAALSQAVVVFGCSKNPKHVHKLPAGEVAEITDNGRVLTFRRHIECPQCWEDPGVFGPPFCVVLGIEWEPPG